jgi:hypothetical protein
MISNPRMALQTLFTLGNDWKNFTDLEPSEENMQIRSSSPEAPSAICAFDFSEPSVEEEHVSDGDTLITQMALRVPSLSKRWPPAGESILRISVQIWIQMNGARGCVLATAQIGNQSADIDVGRVNVIEREGIHA